MLPVPSLHSVIVSLMLAVLLAPLASVLYSILVSRMLDSLVVLWVTGFTQYSGLANLTIDNDSHNLSVS